MVGMAASCKVKGVQKGVHRSGKIEGKEDGREGRGLLAVFGWWKKCISADLSYNLTNLKK